jgi:hypothetical protein
MTVDPQLAGREEDSAPDLMTNTKNWLNWHGDFDNPNVSEDVWVADDESDSEQ